MKIIKVTVSVLIAVILSSYLLLFSLFINLNATKYPSTGLVFIDHQQTGITLSLGLKKYQCGYMKFIPTEHERQALKERCRPQLPNHFAVEADLQSSNFESSYCNCSQRQALVRENFQHTRFTVLHCCYRI